MNGTESVLDKSDGLVAIATKKSCFMALICEVAKLATTKFQFCRALHRIGFFEFCSEKGCSKCVNLLIMRFDGSVSENL